MPSHLTTREVAGLLKVTPARVRQLLILNRLKGERRGRDWWIDPESVQRYLERKERRD